MTTADHASYLASIIAVMDSFDDAARPRPSWLADEYERAWGDYRKSVEDDNKARERQTEQRKSNEESR